MKENDKLIILLISGVILICRQRMKQKQEEQKMEILVFVIIGKPVIRINAQNEVNTKPE